MFWKKRSKYEVFVDAIGEYRFNLLAPNGKVIAVSEGYKTKNSVIKGINAVRKHAVTNFIEVK